MEVTGAEIISTTLNGDYLWIPATAESALGSWLASKDVSWIRDDEVIRFLGPEQ